MGGGGIPSYPFLFPTPGSRLLAMSSRDIEEGRKDLRDFSIHKPFFFHLSHVSMAIRYGPYLFGDSLELLCLLGEQSLPGLLSLGQFLFVSFDRFGGRGVSLARRRRQLLVQFYSLAGHSKQFGAVGQRRLTVPRADHRIPVVVGLRRSGHRYDSAVGCRLHQRLVVDDNHFGRRHLKPGPTPVGHCLPAVGVFHFLRLIVHSVVFDIEIAIGKYVILSSVAVLRIIVLLIPNVLSSGTVRLFGEVFGQRNSDFRFASALILRYCGLTSVRTIADDREIGRRNHCPFVQIRGRSHHRLRHWLCLNRWHCLLDYGCARSDRCCRDNRNSDRSCGRGCGRTGGRHRQQTGFETSGQRTEQQKVSCHRNR